MKTQIMPEPTREPTPPPLPDSSQHPPKKKGAGSDKIVLGVFLAIVAVSALWPLLWMGVKTASDMGASLTMPHIEDGFYFATKDLETRIPELGTIFIRDMKTHGFIRTGRDYPIKKPIKVIIPIRRLSDFTKQFSYYTNSTQGTATWTYIDSQTLYVETQDSKPWITYFVRYDPNLDKKTPYQYGKWLGAVGYAILYDLARQDRFEEEKWESLDFALPLIPPSWIESSDRLARERNYIVLENYRKARGENASELGSFYRK